MPYTRIWVGDDDEAARILKLARAQEIDAARISGRQPKRITLRAVVSACFDEGLADLEARASEFDQPEEDDDDE